ncbi:hypothetical protein SSX86_033128, partial [Deinandra increscens subsp. villosa]
KKDNNVCDEQPRGFESVDVGLQNCESSDPCNIKEFLNKFDEGEVVSLSLSVPPGFERIVKNGEGDVNSRAVKVIPSLSGAGVTPAEQVRKGEDDFSASKIVTGVNRDSEATVSDEVKHRGVGRGGNVVDNKRVNNASLLEIVDNFIQVVIGNGEDTRFWEDIWVGNESLAWKYPRLYALEINKSCKIADRIVGSSRNWEWRRQIRGGIEESQFTSLVAFLGSIMVNNARDGWAWNLD